MNNSARMLTALCVLLSPLQGFASVIWEVAFHSAAYNAVTGAVGSETVRYRYDPADLTLTTTCCVLGGPAYTLEGTLLSYTYEGIADGVGGSARLSADNPSLFENSVHFGGTTVSDLIAGGQVLRTPFWANPYEVSGEMFWLLPNAEGRVPLLGGEGEFVWIRDAFDYHSRTGMQPPQGGLSLRFSVSRLPEPGSLVLLTTSFLCLFASAASPRGKSVTA